jgi:hypothetical protein
MQAYTNLIMFADMKSSMTERRKRERERERERGRERKRE